MKLTREKGLRMWGGGGTGGSGGGGGLDPSALAGYATMGFVEDNYVSKAFFNQLFELQYNHRVLTKDGETVVSDVTTAMVAAPNEVVDTTSHTETDEETGYTIITTNTITGIKAKAGLWTNQYLSALGQNAGGGGGGGATLFEPLLSINESGLAAPTDAQDGMTVVWDKNTHKWKYGATGGGGITVDSALSLTSENPVQNKVITEDIKEASAQTCQNIVDELIGSGGGGGSLNQPLSAINSADLGTPSQSGVAIMWNGTAWAYQVPVGGTAQYTQKVFLAENGGVLTQAMINTPNTIYVIQYDFDLNGETIEIPEGCILEFDGGSLSNGTVVSNNTFVKNISIDAIPGIKIVNGFISVEVNSSRSGYVVYPLCCFGDYNTYPIDVFTMAVSGEGREIIIPNGLSLESNNACIINWQENVRYNKVYIHGEAKKSIVYVKHDFGFLRFDNLEISNISFVFRDSDKMDQLRIYDCNDFDFHDNEISGIAGTTVLDNFGGGIHCWAGKNIRIYNNYIHDGFGDGILVHVSASDVHIYHNIVDNIRHIGIELEGRTGSLGSTVSAPIINFIVDDNMVFNTGDCGILLLNAYNGTLSNNVIVSNAKGIHISGGSRITVSSNHVLSVDCSLACYKECFPSFRLSEITISDNSFYGGIGVNFYENTKRIPGVVLLQSGKNINFINNHISYNGNRKEDGRGGVLSVISNQIVNIRGNIINNIAESPIPCILLARGYRGEEIVGDSQNISFVLDKFQNGVSIIGNQICGNTAPCAGIASITTFDENFVNGVANTTNDIIIAKNSFYVCNYDAAGIDAFYNATVEGNIVSAIANGYRLNSIGASNLRPSTAFNGQKYYDTSLNAELIYKGGKWTIDGAAADAKRKGSYAERPSSSDIYIGFRFFCTDRIIDMNSESATYLQVITAPVGEGGIDIIYKGQDTTDPDNPVDIWVDALGRVVS